jgi:hypothetical protein
MAGKIIGSVEKIIAQFGIAGGRIRRAVNDQIEKEAQAVGEVARAMTPRDLGHMESAIRVTSQSQRRIWTVYIDDDVKADGPKRGEMSGKYTVGDYLTFLHEGSYKLGDKSLEKQATTPHVVGRKFLERAFRKRMREGMVRRITAAARNAGVL